jgi:hypothetical protein
MIHSYTQAKRTHSPVHHVPQRLALILLARQIRDTMTLKHISISTAYNTLLHTSKTNTLTRAPRATAPRPHSPCPADTRRCRRSIASGTSPCRTDTAPVRSVRNSDGVGQTCQGWRSERSERRERIGERRKRVGERAANSRAQKASIREQKARERMQTPKQCMVIAICRNKNDQAKNRSAYLASDVVPQTIHLGAH